jgi:hypothetical protein
VVGDALLLARFVAGHQSQHPRSVNRNGLRAIAGGHW